VFNRKIPHLYSPTSPSARTLAVSVKANRTNSTFGFLQTQKPTLKNQKSCFLPTLEEIG